MRDNSPAIRGVVSEAGSSKPRTGLRLRGGCTRLAALLLAALLPGCLVPSALAQTDAGAVTGLVTDPSGAIVVGAKLTLVNIDQNTETETKSNASGLYVFPSIQPGRYLIRVERDGFKVANVTGLTVNTEDHLEENIRLEVGSTSESVTVNGEGATNDSPAVSMTVDREFVENMPLNGRSFQDLIQLAPGTASTATENGYYSIDGQRTDSNNYTVDGVSANLGGINNAAGSYGGSLSGSSPSQTELGTTQSLASIDALQEFTIQTSGYTAEYGRNPGGQVQFTTRSGTNTIHGTLFDYLRNTVFDANSDQNDYRGDPKTAEHQNDFGGTFGGPLMIPHLYNGRDRTFYFLSYEGLRLLLPSDEDELDPTAAFISAASPYVQPFLSSVPPPNTSIAGDSCTVSGTTINPTGPASPAGPNMPCDEEFYYAFSYPSNLDSYSARIDHEFSSRIHAFLRYADTPSSIVTGAGKTITSAINTHIWTAGATLKITDTILNEFRFNYSHDGEESVYGQVPLNGSVPFPRNLLIPSEYDGPYAYGSGYVSLPGTSLNLNPYYGGTGSAQHQYQIVDSLAWAHGTHSIKFGGDWRRLTPVLQTKTYDSTIHISSQAAIQQGYASTVLIQATAPGQPVFDNLSLYAQDHWKIGMRLNLDYGLRWEFNPPPGPANGHYPVALTSNNLATANLAPLGTQPYKTYYDKFAPRFGFAWTPIPLTSHQLAIHGAFGIFYDTGQSVISNAYFAAYPFAASGPTLKNVSLASLSGSLTPPTLSFPITPPYPTLQGISDPDLTLPYTEQWNLSFDEMLNEKNTLTLSYVGNNGKKLLFTNTYVVPVGNPNFFILHYTTNGSQSSYNAFQVQDQGRITNGLDIVGSFTWAHALDNESSDYTGEGPQWGNSDNDLRRSLNLALNYQIPNIESDGIVGALARGWALANRFSAQSGYPLQIVQSYVTLADGSQAEYYPDLVPNIPIYLHGRTADVNGKPVPGNWRLNPAAFAVVPTDPNTGNPIRQGTLGRNFIRTPSFWALNTAVQRSFPVREKLRLDFRAEAFNIFNHPNLGAPDPYLSDSTFGELLNGSVTTIGSPNQLYAMGAARSLQFSLKLLF
jgi:hypothetical protein